MKADVLRPAAGRRGVTHDSDGSVSSGDAHEHDLFVPEDLFQLERITVEAYCLLQIPHGYDEEEGCYLGH